MNNMGMLISMLKSGGNPQAMLQNMVQQRTNNNPLMQNVYKMMMNNNTKGLEELTRQICKEKGIDADALINQVKSQL